MVDSIQWNAEGIQVDLKLFFDDDKIGYNKFKTNQRIQSFYSPERIGAVGGRNTLLRLCEDAIIYATDDMIFKPGAIAAAIRAARAHFADDDFVIGFFQEGNTFNPAGVALVGQAFLQRYPDKKLFFPGYFHFACQEVHAAAEKLGKFYLAEDARIYHFHPCVDPKQMDQTHQDARYFKTRDMAMIKDRKAKGLIWGIN